jgi:hypothetical protein
LYLPSSFDGGRALANPEEELIDEIVRDTIVERATAASGVERRDIVFDRGVGAWREF